MKNIKIIILSYLFSISAVNATAVNTAEEYCQNEINYERCIRTIRKLPPVKALPKLITTTPTPIKVIPYETNQKNKVINKSGRSTWTMTN